MTPEVIAADCFARWKDIYDARTIDLTVAPGDVGYRLRRLWRGSPEWAAEFAGADWLDHLQQVGKTYTTFRELVRADLLLNLIPTAGPVRAPAMVDELIPTA